MSTVLRVHFHWFPLGCDCSGFGFYWTCECENFIFPSPKSITSERKVSVFFQTGNVLEIGLKEMIQWNDTSAFESMQSQVLKFCFKVNLEVKLEIIFIFIAVQVLWCQHLH